MKMELDIAPDGTVTGKVTDAGNVGNGGGDVTDGAVAWVPDSAGPYVNTGHATLGQLYYYDGPGMPGMKAELSLASPPNYSVASGATEGLEQGASAGHSPIVWSEANPWRIYFKVVSGGPDNVVPVTLNSNYFPL